MKNLITILFLCFFGVCFSQAEQVELSVHLKNNDILTGTSELRTLVFNTDFGTLNFPIDQINSIKIGLTDSRFDKGNLLNLLSRLDNGGTKDKEAAFDDIIKMDEGAIPFIKAYINNSKVNNSDLSPQTLYEVMLAKYKVARNYSLNDIITYKSSFSVEGTYDFTNLILETSYGRIKVERNDIARIDVKITSNGIANKNTFKLFANQHVSGNKDDGWLNTGILVKKGDQISIDAQGQIVLASLSGNSYTPDGGVNGSLGVESNKTSYGQVMYKISQGGDELKVGSKFSGVAQQTGILYLSIFESVFNSANSGYYTINVN